MEGSVGVEVNALMRANINFAVWEGDFLVARGSAIDFLDWLSAQGKTVKGAEGFTFDGEHFTSLTECIQDYPGSEGDYIKSTDFFKRILTTDIAWQTKPHYIEFVID